MEFYKIKNNQLHLSNKLSQEDIVFIIDGIAGYIWKGINAVEMDEITAKEAEIIINEKFKEMSFNLILDLDIKKTENQKIAQIKREILKRLPRSIIEKKSRTFSPSYVKLKTKFKNLKEYDVSIESRKKLSTSLTLWRLSVFNCLILIVSIYLILDILYFHFFNSNILSFIVLLLMIFTFGINLIFVFFPKKFPKKFLTQNIKKDENSKKKITDTSSD